MLKNTFFQGGGLKIHPHSPSGNKGLKNFFLGKKFYNQVCIDDASRKEPAMIIVFMLFSFVSSDYWSERI